MLPVAGNQSRGDFRVMTVLHLVFPSWAQPAREPAASEGSKESMIEQNAISSVSISRHEHALFKIYLVRDATVTINGLPWPEDHGYTICRLSEAWCSAILVSFSNLSMACAKASGLRRI